MYDYPSFDGSQSCQDPSPEAARAFGGALGADPAPALSLCASCLFSTQCRDYALTHDVYGVWGGTTENDRVQARTENNLPAPEPITAHLDDLVASLRTTRPTTADLNDLREVS